MSEKITKILLPASIIVAGIIIAGALVYLDQEKNKEAEDTTLTQQIAEKAIDYINENFNVGDNIASLIGVEDAGSGVYKIKLKIGEQEYESYASKDGRLLFPEGYNLEEETEETTDASGVDLPKRERPDVKLFVMSFCPYGLQDQKMFLPVYELLKDKADIGVYFVNYIMHEKQEIDENLNQYCIQKEEEQKYAGYLNCFVVSGDSEKCLIEADIDRTKLNNCITETDQEYNIYGLYNDKSAWIGSTCPDPPYCFPRFDVQGDLNEKYGVQGSPTVVINDQVVDVNPRSPENFKKTVCQAFNSSPEECGSTLSSGIPSPGIGGGTSDSSGGECK